jgi:hypothetical protein
MQGHVRADRRYRLWVPLHLLIAPAGEAGGGKKKKDPGKKRKEKREENKEEKK